MLSIIASFLVGLLVIPIFYLLSAPAACILRKRHGLRDRQCKDIPISERLKEDIVESMVKSSDVAWLNVIIQRMFVQAVRNPAFEERIRRIILSNFVSLTRLGIVKGVRITKISMGNEAPYINNIRVLNKKSLDELVCPVKKETIDQACGIEDDYSAKDFETRKPFVNRTVPEKKGPRGLYRAMNKNVSSAQIPSIRKEESGQAEDLDSNILFMDNTVRQGTDKNLRELMKESMPLESTLQEIYKDLVCAADVEYKGGFQLTLEVELPKKVFVPGFISLRRLEGTILFKLPARDYDTRYEYSFVPNPIFEIEAVSSINGRKKAFFQNSISKLLKATLQRAFRRSLVYPNWYSNLNWFVLIPKKLLRLKQVLSTADEEEIAVILSAIKIHMGADYKIKKEHHGIVYRENSAAGTSMAHFQLPLKFQQCSTEDFCVFNDLSIHESKILSACASLKILQQITVRNAKIEIGVSNRRCSEVTIQFGDSTHSFIRIMLDDAVVFFKNHTGRAEFFIFRVFNGELQVFNHSRCKDYALTSRRIHKLKRWVWAEPNVVLGSRMLYRITRFKKKHLVGETARKEQIAEEELYETTELSDIFKKLLSTPREALSTNSFKVPLDPNTLYRVISDNSVRLRLLLGEFSLCRPIPETEKISCILITSQKEEYIVHSYQEENTIVDVCIAKDIFYIFRIEQAENMSVLHMDCRESLDNLFFNNLCCSLSIRAVQINSYSATSAYPYAQAAVLIQEELKTNSGTVYLEFTAPAEDDFHLKIISCKREKTMIEIKRIISSRPFRLLLPVEKDFIRVELIPKRKRNETINYKLLNLETERDMLLDCMIGLMHREKLSVQLYGFPTHKIYWDSEERHEVKRYIEEHKKTTILGHQGVVASGCRNCKLVFKNKGFERCDMKVLLGLAKFPK